MAGASLARNEEELSLLIGIMPDHDQGCLATEAAKRLLALLCAAYMLYALVWMHDAPIPAPPAWLAIFAGVLMGWNADDL